jgi:hypothetical protein
MRISKAYFYKDFEGEFVKKHAYLCINDMSSERNLVRASARYPSEIKASILFMGNMMNVLDKNNEQLRVLGIKTIVYFSPNKFEHLEENKEFECHHFEVKEQDKPVIDMEAAAEIILAQVNKKTPIFVFDVSGILAAAVCTKILLETNKGWTREIATMFIINKRYEAKDIPAWLYK